MLPAHKSSMKAVVFLIVLHCCLAVSTSEDDHSDSISGPSATLNPVTTLVKTKLEQLKQMEESALEGWYKMVNGFLMIIKPDKKTLDYVINFVSGNHSLSLQETVLEIARVNYAFLIMIIIGIIYVVVMLVSGICFLCCRFCGRCGAKNSQRQRHTDNCWRTTHKFCLVLMIAFLVVPITCMCIINVHMKQSFPSVKGNASEIFTILEIFANTTDEDVKRETESAFSSDSFQDFDAFRTHFVDIIHENISSSIDHEKLEEIKNIVNWVLSVEDQHSSIANGSALSESVKRLKSLISSIRHQTQSLHNCTNSDKSFCRLDLKPLPVEKIDVDKAFIEVQSEFQKLLKMNFKELRNVIDKVQNNSILKSKIEEESESLKRFSEEVSANNQDVPQNIQEIVKQYTDKLREFSAYGSRLVKRGFAETDGYEQYRWWIMFGIAVVLIVPVLFLTLGLICGCCGHEKDRHPTKRSSSSNCGGLFLVSAVYNYFLIASALMLVTIALFVIGGNVQTFVCAPLYEDNFEVLDEIKEKLEPYLAGTFVQNVTISKFLIDCENDMSILHALGLINQTDPSTIENLWKRIDVKELNEEEIDGKLRSALLETTSGVRKKLRDFSNALNLKEMKDLPQKLKEYLKTSKASISKFIDEIKASLNEDVDDDMITKLHFVDESATMLFDAINDFEKELNNFSSTLLNIYNEAENYKVKIREMEKNLDKVEESLPKVIKSHLFQAVASGSDWERLQNIGRCKPVWIAFDMTRISACEFVVYPVNGFWFGLGWALIFVIPTILFAIKLSRYYLRMKYDDDLFIHDSGESVPLEDLSRGAKPFSYTNPGAMSWMPPFNQHQNYVVHPTSNNQMRQFYYK